MKKKVCLSLPWRKLVSILCREPGLVARILAFSVAVMQVHSTVVHGWEPIYIGLAMTSLRDCGAGRLIPQHRFNIEVKSDWVKAKVLLAALIPGRTSPTSRRIYPGTPKIIVDGKLSAPMAGSILSS